MYKIVISTKNGDVEEQIEQITTMKLVTAKIVGVIMALRGNNVAITEHDNVTGNEIKKIDILKDW